MFRDQIAGVTIGEVLKICHFRLDPREFPDAFWAFGGLEAVPRVPPPASP
jgi:hypothetical protein